MHQVVRDWRGADLAPEDRALCEFSAELTHHPQHMTPDHLEALRAHGFGDRAIHDAAQVAAFFNYITRIADALGVEPETSITRWG